MYKYIFYGVIHPERVGFGLNSSVIFEIDIPDFGIKGQSLLKFDQSKLIIEFTSNINYLPSPEATSLLETLKNYIEENARLVVDIYCSYILYLHSRCIFWMCGSCRQALLDIKDPSHNLQSHDVFQ